MSKPVALLDVDHTLMVNSKDRNASDSVLNTPLLDALQSHGINDVYLFTDMIFRGTDIEDRENLITALKSRGFTVHGVLSPNDLSWNGVDGSEALALDKIGYRGQLSGETFSAVVAEQHQTLGITPFYQATSSFDHAVPPGESYQAAQTQFSTQGQIDADTLDKSCMAKVAADEHARRVDYVHTKGLMLQWFLQHNPDVQSIVIADDNQDVIRACQDCIQRRDDPNVRLTLIHVPDTKPLDEDYNKSFRDNPEFPFNPTASLLARQEAARQELAIQQFTAFLQSEADDSSYEFGFTLATGTAGFIGAGLLTLGLLALFPPAGAALGSLIGIIVAAAIVGGVLGILAGVGIDMVRGGEARLKPDVDSDEGKAVPKKGRVPAPAPSVSSRLFQPASSSPMPDGQNNATDKKMTP